MAEGTSAVNITLQASDKASVVFDATKQSVASLGLAVANVQSKFVAMGTAIAGAGAIATAKISGLYGAFQNVSAIARQPIVATALQQIYDEAVATTEELQSLTDVLGGLGAGTAVVGGGALSGLLGVKKGELKTAEQRATEALNSALSTIKGNLNQNVEQGLKTLKGKGKRGGLYAGILESALGVASSDDVTEAVSDNLKEKVRNAAKDIAIDKVKNNAAGLLQGKLPQGNAAQTINLASTVAKVTGVGNFFSNVETQLVSGIAKTYGKFYDVADKGIEATAQRVENTIARNVSGAFTSVLTGAIFKRPEKTPGFVQAQKAINDAVFNVFNPTLNRNTKLISGGLSQNLGSAIAKQFKIDPKQLAGVDTIDVGFFEKVLRKTQRDLASTEKKIAKEEAQKNKTGANVSGIEAKIAPVQKELEFLNQSGAQSQSIYTKLTAELAGYEKALEKAKQADDKAAKSLADTSRRREVLKDSIQEQEEQIAKAREKINKGQALAKTDAFDKLFIAGSSRGLGAAIGGLTQNAVKNNSNNVMQTAARSLIQSYIPQIPPDLLVSEDVVKNVKKGSKLLGELLDDFTKTPTKDLAEGFSKRLNSALVGGIEFAGGKVPDRFKTSVTNKLVDASNLTKKQLLETGKDLGVSLVNSIATSYMGTSFGGTLGKAIFRPGTFKELLNTMKGEGSAKLSTELGKIFGADFAGAIAQGINSPDLIKGIFKDTDGIKRVDIGKLTQQRAQALTEFKKANEAALSTAKVKDKAIETTKGLETNVNTLQSEIDNLQATGIAPDDKNLIALNKALTINQKKLAESAAAQIQATRADKSAQETRANALAGLKAANGELVNAKNKLVDLSALRKEEKAAQKELTAAQKEEAKATKELTDKRKESAEAQKKLRSEQRQKFEAQVFQGADEQQKSLPKINAEIDKYKKLLDAAKVAEKEAGAKVAEASAKRLQAAEKYSKANATLKETESKVRSGEAVINESEIVGAGRRLGGSFLFQKARDVAEVQLRDFIKPMVGEQFANNIANAVIRPERIQANLAQAVNTGLTKVGLSNLGGMAGNLISDPLSLIKPGQGKAIAGQLAGELTASQPLVNQAFSFLINGGINLIKTIIKAFQFGALFVQKFKEIDQLLNGLLSTTFFNLGTRIVTRMTQGVAVGAAKGIFNPIFEQVGKLVNFVDEGVLKITKRIQEIPQQFQQGLDVASKPFAFLAGLNEPLEVFNEMQNVVGGFANRVNAVSQQIFFFTSAFDSLKGLVANGPFQMLIGQNTELRSQLLQTQSSLVATNKISVDGVQIKDPTKAITALNAPVQAAIADIRRGSLELSGVTSKDIIGVFNIISTQASQANINIKQSAQLALDFSAALGTINMPLSMAQQEISSILTGQTDSNSTLAKTLGLQNDQLRKLAQQGKLYEFLNDKLKAFRAGNAIASRSLEGVTSNIEEIVQNTFLKAGAGMLDPMIDQVSRFYIFLSGNQKFLEDYVTGIVDNITKTGLSFVKIAEAIGEGAGEFLLAIPQYLFKELAAGAEGLADAISGTLSALKPFFDLLAQLAQFVITNLSGLPAKIFIGLQVLNVTVGVLTKSFGIMANLLPGVGQALFFITMRSGGLVNQFAFLRKELNTSSAAFLLLGKNLAAIPGGMNFIASKFPIFGGAIAGMIPQISGLAIALVGMNSKFPVVGNIVQEFAGVVGKDLLPALGAAAKAKGLDSLGDTLAGFGDKVGDVSKKGDLLALAQQKMAEYSKEAGAAIRKQAITMGVWGAAIAIGLVAFNEFLKRQEDGGKPIYDLAKKIEVGTATIRSVWDKTRKTTKDPLIANNDIPPTDWVDTWILKMRQLESGTMEVKNFWDGIWAIVAVIGEVINYGIVKPVQTVGNLVGSFVGVIMNALDAMSIALKNPLDPKNIQEAMQRLGSGTVEIAKGAAEEFKSTWTSSMKDVETKSEETFREISEAVSSGKLQSAVNDNVKAINDLVKGGKNAGNLFGDALNPVKTAIAGLKDGTTDIDAVKAAIAGLPDTIPKNRRDDLVALLDKEFPDGVKNSKKSADELSTSFTSLNNAVDLTNADASNTMLQEIRESTEDQISSIDQQIDALKKSNRGNSEAARTLRSLKAQLEAARDSFNNFTNSVQVSADPVKQLMNKLTQFDEELKRVNNTAANSEKGRTAAAMELKRQGLISDQKIEQDKLKFATTSNKAIYLETLKRYKEAQDAYNKLTDKEKAKATELKDKMMELEGQLSDSRIKYSEAAIQESENTKKNLIEDFDETQKGIEASKAKGTISEKQYIEQSLKNNLAKNDLEVSQAKEKLSKLDAADKEGREALNARLAELATEREKILSDSNQKEIALIDRLQQKALDIATGAETDRLTDLQKLRNQDLISEAEFNEKKVNSDRQRINKELGAEQAKLKALLALPKPSDPEEAEKQEAQIRGSRNKTKQLTLSLLQNEKAQYDAHLNTLTEAIKRQSTKEAIERQKAINAGTMSREESTLKEAEATARGLEKQIAATTKDKDKKLELEKQYQEAIEKIRDAKVAARLAQINKESLQEQIAIQNKINVGTATEEQANLARAQSTLKSAEEEVKLRQKGTTAYLEAEKKRVDAVKAVQDAIVAEKLAGINKESTIAQNAVLKQVSEGKAIAETASRIRVENELKATEAELKIRKAGTKEYLAAEGKKYELIKQLRDAKVAEKLAAINKETVAEQIEIAKRVANGTAVAEEAAVAKLQGEARANEEALKLYQKGTKEYQDAELKKYELIKQVRDAKVAEKFADLNKETLREQVAIARRVAAGTATEEEANTVKVENEIKANNAALQIYKKGTKEYLEAEVKKYDLAKQLREAKIAEKLAQINQEQLQEQIALQKGINKGSIKDEDANVIRQQQTIDRIKAELALETTNKTKILELRKSLAEAEGALQDAIVAKKKADLERQNQALQNTITKQNQSLEKQLNLHDRISKALDNRAKLLDATKEYTSAVADGLTGELDVMASLEKSEYKKRQLAETAAAIKLKALEKQLEFERESMEMQQAQNALALEREKIQARINAAQAEADVAKAKADLAIAEADPKTTREQREAARLNVQAQEMKRDASIDQYNSLIEQQQNQTQIDQMQRKSLDIRQRGQRNQAIAGYIETLTPGARNRAAREFKNQLAQGRGYDSYRDLRESGVRMSRQEILKEILPGVGYNQGNATLEAFDPELGDLQEVLSPQRFKTAFNDTQNKFDVKFGDFAQQIPNAFASSVGRVMQLPKELELKQSKLSLPPSQQKLQLPEMSKLSNSGNKMLNAVTDFSDTVSKFSSDSINRTYNITVNVPGSNTQTVTKQEILAGIGRAIQQAERAIL